MAGNLKESINLLNFTEEKFLSSKFILTSPTSLKACKNLSIRPIDLLPAQGTRNGNAESQLLEKQQREANRLNLLYKALRERERLLGMVLAPSSAKSASVPAQPLATGVVGRHASSGKESLQSSTKRPLSANCQRSYSHSHVKEDERILRALSCKLERRRELEERGRAVRLAWLGEAEDRARTARDRSREHQRQLALHGHREQLKEEERRGRHRGEDTRRAGQQQWEAGALRQRQLREQQQATSRTHRDGLRRRLEVKRARQGEVEQWCSLQLAEQSQLALQRASLNRDLLERTSAISRKVHRVTDQARVVSRVQALEEDRAAQRQQLQAAIQLKSQRSDQHSLNLGHSLSHSRVSQHWQQVRCNRRQLWEQEQVKQAATQHHSRLRVSRASRACWQGSRDRASLARRSREARHRGQRRRLEGLRASEEQRLGRARDAAQRKEGHSRQLAEDRAAHIQALRQHAAATTELREQLAEKLSIRTFDKLAQEAQIRVALEKKTSVQRQPPRVLLA